MSTLKQKAEQILQEKEEKITPGEFLNTQTIFGIDGTFQDYRDDGQVETSDAPRIMDMSADGYVEVLSNPDDNDLVINSATDISTRLDCNDLAREIGLTADKIKKDEIILNIPGTFEGTDTSDATALENDIVEGKTAYTADGLVEGTIRDFRTGMENAGADINYVSEDGTGNLIMQGAMNFEDIVTTDGTPIDIEVQESMIASAVGLTADIIKKDEEILGIIGEYEGVDTSDANATENDLVEGTSAYVNGVKIEGTLYDERYESGYYSFENIGIMDNPDTEQIETEGEIILPNGYTGVVFTNNMKMGYGIPYSDISSAIELDSNVIAPGHTVLGVEGTYEGIDTSDATATENDIVENTSAYVDGVKLDGTLMDSREQSTIPYVGSAYYGTDYGTTSTVSFKLPQNTPDMVISSENEFLGYINNANFAYSIGLTADILKKNENVLGVIGTLDAGTDTSDANATANDLIENTTAYVDGVKLEGAIGDSRDDSLDIIPETAYVLSHTALTVVGHLDLPCASSSIAINNGTSIYMSEIDLTASNITDEIGLVPEVIKKGETILGITGTLEGGGTDTRDATATANDLVENTTAYVSGVKLQGTITDDRNQSGYHELDYSFVSDYPDYNGVYIGGNIKSLPATSSSVVFEKDASIDVLVPYSAMVSELNITPGIIKKDEVILGVTGTYEGGGSTPTVNTTLNLQVGERYNSYDNLPYMTFANLNSASFDITQLYNWNRNNGNGTPISQTILEMPYVYLKLEITEHYELAGGLEVMYELVALDKPLIYSFNEYGSEAQVAKNCYKASMQSGMFTNTDYDPDTGDEYIPEGKNYATFNEFWTDFCNSIYNESAIKCVKPNRTTTYEVDTMMGYLYSNLI